MADTQNQFAVPAKGPVYIAAEEVRQQALRRTYNLLKEDWGGIPQAEIELLKALGSILQGTRK